MHRRLAARLVSTIASLWLLAACTPKQDDSEKNPTSQAPRSAASGETLLVLSPKDTSTLLLRAKSLGLQVSGTTVLTVNGSREAIARFAEDFSGELDLVHNENLSVEKDRDFGEVDEQVLYLAKKDFGLIDYWALHPEHDGRDVIVGVVDDGISPHQSGFQVTTTGERKYLAHGSQSSAYELVLENAAEADASPYLASLAESFDEAWIGLLDEATPLSTYDGLSEGFDLNEDDALSTLAIAAIRQADTTKICVDLNVNEVAEQEECFGDFATTGNYTYWTQDKLIALMADFSAETGRLKLYQGERSGDGHGEGVASVLAGHQIAGRFDGVAPGAKILDYDLSERTSRGEEDIYTISTFLTAFEWLGERGAEVINVSYSLFFASAKGQLFMQKAIEALQEKYGFIISFSAGNNGPGLSSLNRRSIYPADALVAGAYVGRELDEYVHGVTGLPEEGRVVYYSSRGPGPAGGQGPLVISPLASLTHRDPRSGFSAFSGTSSASPALAGLATVLISAVKAEGLPLDPGSVAHALRLSGSPLPSIPFVEQGSGLPKMAAALAWYRKLVSGAEYKRILTTVSGSDGVGPDGLTRDGVILQGRVTNEATKEFRVGFKGILAQSAPSDRPSEMLRLYQLEYSHPWLSGPRSIWVAAGSVHEPFFVADIAAGLGEEGTAAFGEIRLLDEQGSVIHVVPVTLFNHAKLSVDSLSARFAGVLGAEDGKAYQLQVEPGVSALRIRTKVISGNGDRLGVQVYDQSAVKVASAFGIARTEDLLVPVDGSGWHQVALFRSKGSEVALNYEIEVAAVMIATPTTTIHPEQPFVLVNHGARQDFSVSLQRASSLIHESVVQLGTDASSSVELPIENVGTYSLRLELLAAPEWTYFYPSCVAELQKESASTFSVTSDTIEVATDWLGGVLRLSCYAFDTVKGDEEAQGLPTKLQVFHAPTENDPLWSAPVRLESGRSELDLRDVDFSSLTSVGLQFVWKPLFDGTGSFTTEGLHLLP